MRMHGRRMVVCGAAAAVILGIGTSAGAIGYDDFPPDLQLILDERIAELNAEGGVCIAGRVRFSDGAPISGGTDVLVIFRPLPYLVLAPVRVYANGWFMLGANYSSNYAGADRMLTLRAFGYEPIDASVTILDGQMTYLEHVLDKTLFENLVTITGTVVDENDQPFPGAAVSLMFPFPYGAGGTPFKSVTTSVDGSFAFAGLSSTDYRLNASRSDYASHQVNPAPPAGGGTVETLKLYPNRRVIVEYVYQADGSTSFTSGALQTGTIDWLCGSGHLDFSQGRVELFESNDTYDLELFQVQDVMHFHMTRLTGDNGFYVAGDVPFDSVTEAAASGYPNARVPCVVGRVYVVRTFEEQYYAKLIVRANERSFVTVPPGDSAPFAFATYGLTADVNACSAHTRLYVQKVFAAPANVSGALPTCWMLSGMSGATFEADLTFSYDDAEVTAAGLTETSLAVMRSTDGGASWTPIAAYLDTAANTLTVSGLTAVGRFTIAGLGDSDSDGVPDVCDDCPNTIPGVPVDAAGCPLPVAGDFNGDGDVDLADFSTFQACFNGPNRLPAYPG
ncbi:MAG: carboxypeptidase regulatory-like domain-containing protein, partial [Phycisphaerae bacterium]|nr:carboxypeptidase regulatory-like domain-containing protein [Phycisphaerae bacterium]